MPYSKSLPFSSLLDSQTFTPKDASEPATYTTLKSPEGLLKALEQAVGPAYAQAVLKGERGVIASCGSGMTAGVIWLALKSLGAERVALYDEASSMFIDLVDVAYWCHSHGPVMRPERVAKSRRISRRPLPYCISSEVGMSSGIIFVNYKALLDISGHRTHT